MLFIALESRATTWSRRGADAVGAVGVELDGEFEGAAGGGEGVAAEGFGLGVGHVGGVDADDGVAEVAGGDDGVAEALGLDGGGEGADEGGGEAGRTAGESEGGGGEEGVAATEGVDGGRAECGDVLGGDAVGVAVGGVAFGDGSGLEGDEAVGAHGEHGGLRAGLAEESPGEGGETFVVRLEDGADFGFAGAEEVEAGHLAEAGAAAGDVAGHDAGAGSEFAAESGDEGGREEAEAEVGDDGGVEAGAGGVEGHGEQLFVGGGVEDGGLDEVELHDLLSADEEALLFRERVAGFDAADFDAFDGEALDEIVGELAVGAAGDEDGFSAHGGEVAGDDGGAAEVGAALDGAEGHDGTFAGDVGAIAEEVGVDDGFADDEDALAAEGGDELGEAFAGEFVDGEELSEAFVVGVDALFEGGDESGGAEDDVTGGEDDASAVGLDGFAFGAEAWVGVGFVLAALDVDVGLDFGEEFDGGGTVFDVDPIDEGEGGEILGAELFGDEGASGALLHLGVAGDGDEEEVAFALGLAEVSDVAGVDDVEAAVALDDGFAGGAGLGPAAEQLLVGEDFLGAGIGGITRERGARRGRSHGKTIGGRA